MSFGAGLAVWAAATALVAALGGDRSRARAGLALACALLVLPFVLAGEPMLRALVAYLAVVTLAAAVDFAAARTHPRFAGRLLHVLALPVLVDTFTAKSVPRTFDARSAIRTVVALGVGAGAMLAWREVASWPQATRAIAWNLAAVVLVLVVAELMTSVVRVVTAPFGISLQPVHDRPHLARTVSEFWSKRWNLMTGSWLRKYCFLSLVRHGPLLAILATFAVSAAMHVYLILVPGDAWSWLMWAAFFMVQPLLLVAERKLHVRHWPPFAGRAWTIGTLALLSPLLFVPILRLVDVSH